MSSKNETRKNSYKNCGKEKNVNEAKFASNVSNCKQKKIKESKAMKNSQKKKNDNKKLGKKGEDAAVNFLINKGYEILDRNWKCSFGEADIVAVNENILTFIEVKTRASLKSGMPEDAVNSKKRKRYECIAASYLQHNDYVDMPVRFDVIAILVLSDKRALIRHHINAFGLG